jgi:Icc protein
MSGIGQPKLSRRQLLKGSLALAAGVITLGPRRAWADDFEFDQCTRWAFLSDTHIAADPENHYRGFYPYRNLQEVLWQIGYDLPQGVVITGDLARLKGRTQAYENLKAMLSPIAAQRPVYLGLGNHDCRDDFFSTFENADTSGEVVENRHVFSADAGAVRLIVLDTLLHVNRLAGLLGLPQRTWLANYLAACDDKPTILCLHHTPRFDLLDTAGLFDIIGPATKVKAVVFGHSHKLDFSQYKGIHLINLPATGFNFSDNQPVGWMEAALTATGGEFTLHTIGGDREFEGHTEKLVWRS